MQLRVAPAIAFALLALLALLATGVAVSAEPLLANARVAPDDALRALDGEWLYVEDRTEGRALEQLGPPMSAQFLLQVENGAVVLNGHGSGHKNVRVALDGSVTEIKEQGKIARYRGTWKDATFAYEVAFTRESDNATDGAIRAIRRSFRSTPDGLIVGVTVNPPEGTESVALYRHVDDIELPEPAEAGIDDLDWLAGAWAGTRGTSSIEERWSPPRGGAMLGVSRTVKSGKMSAFEFLRIVERDGGLVYIAQPNGAPPTEFVLTEVGKTRAVFDNPRHDYPKRIVYELSAEGALSTMTGYLKGGTPRRVELVREEG